MEAVHRLAFGADQASGRVAPVSRIGSRRGAHGRGTWPLRLAARTAVLPEIKVAAPAAAGEVVDIVVLGVEVIVSFVAHGTNPGLVIGWMDERASNVDARCPILMEMTTATPRIRR
jgi:hypothetical protein